VEILVKSLGIDCRQGNPSGFKNKENQYKDKKTARADEDRDTI
jgi:hypothetical protein